VKSGHSHVEKPAWANPRVTMRDTMKKILLATTALAMSAGFAAAEVKVGGSAKAGLASADGGDFAAYSSVKITFAGSGVTDGGLEFGVSTDTTIGNKYDSLGDFDDASVIGGTNDGTWGVPTVFLSGSFGKISFSKNNLDFFDDANGGGDVQYGYTAGDVTVGLVADLETSDYSASLSASVGGVALSVDADTYDLWNASAAYTSGPVTITLSANEASVQKVKVAYSADGMSASAKFGTDDSWEITGGYTAGALSLAILANSGEYQEVTVSSDLGGGALIVAGANNDQDMFAGVEMKF
jgi:outer membrane protein OmpU